MVDSIMVPHSNTNCEEDIDEFLLSLDAINHAKQSQGDLFTVPSSPYEDMVAQLPASVRNILSVCTFPTDLNLQERPDENFSMQERNVLAYISGYIARKLRKKVCSMCEYKFVQIKDPVESEQMEDLMLVREKKYAGAKDGLVVPSQLLIDGVSQIEAVYRCVIDDVMYLDSVKGALACRVLKNVSLEELQCDICNGHLAIIHLMLNVRIHHTLKEANRNLRHSKSRKNRKVLKFSHL